MEFYCSSWGNFFSRQAWLTFGKLFALLLIPYGLLMYLYAQSNGDRRMLMVQMIVAVLFTLFLLMASMSGNKHHFITVDRNLLSWQQSLRDSTRRYSRRYYHVYHLSNITVTNLHNVMFKQTALEQCFNMGRISFEAEIQSIEPVDRRDHQTLPPKPPYEFVGVKSFRRFKEYLHEQLPPSAFAS